jgi:hypothetical protein
MSGIPVFPKDSGVLGRGVLGSMTLGVDYTPLTDLAMVHDPHTVTLIEIYTSAMIFRGVVDNYEHFEYVENEYEPDTFEIYIHQNKVNVSSFVPGGYIRFVIDDGEHICIIESKEVTLDENGANTPIWKISGRGIEAIFCQYICMYGTIGAVVPALTFTFAASTTVTASADCRAAVSVGEYIYNSTDDNNSYAQVISAISANGLTITLARAYTGTAGAGKVATHGTGYHDTPVVVVPTVTFTFAASTTVTASADCRATVKIGHCIFNSTNDTSAKAVKILSISANGLTITLASAYPGTTGAGKAATICGVPGETFIRELVDKECISSSDASANLPGLALAADGARGAIVVRSVRFDYLNDILYGICKETGNFFRLVHTTGFNFVLTIYTGTDVSSTVSITQKRDNVAKFKYVESLLEMKNLLYVGGAGDGAARLVQKVYTGTEPSGWSRRAKFIDAQDLSTGALLSAKGTEVLATMGETLTLEVDYLPSPTHTLGVQFKLGDTITVVFEGTAAMVSKITSITWTWDAGSVRAVKLGLGKEAPDLVSIVKLNEKLNKTNSRR